MPRIAIDTTKGQYTNTDEFASGQPGQIVNLLLDEHGTLTSRPGLLSFANTAGAVAGLAGSTDHSVVAMHWLGDYMICVTAGRRVKRITQAGVVTDITVDFLTGSSHPTFLLDDDGSLLIFGGGAPLRVGPDLQARTFAIGLEGSPTHGAIVDHSLIVNDLGSDNVYFSDIGLGSGSTGGHEMFARTGGRSTPGLFRAGLRADPVSALASLQNRVLLFGEQSVEAFYGTGAGGGAAAFRLEDDPMQSTLGAAYSLLEASDTLWWLDFDRRFVRLEGRGTKTVSSPIEKQLQALGTYSDCIAHLFEYQGRHLILFHFQTDGVTLCYDYALGTWSEWRLWSLTTADWSPMPLLAYAFHPRWNRHFCAGVSRDNGTMFELSSTTYQDNSGPLVRLWRGPYSDAGDLGLKFCKRLQFLLDGGTAQSYTSTSDGYNPTIEVRWRNEDRQWQEWQPMQTGLIGQQFSVRDVWCRSNYRRQQIEWRCSSPVPLRVNRIELEATARMR